MPYETATATNVNDLLDKLRLFLIADGWAVNFWGDRTAAAGKALSVSKSGVLFTWVTDTDNPGGGNPGPYLGVFQHTAYTGGDPDVQPGASIVSWCNRVTGPMQAYHFLGGVGPSGPYAHAVIETDPGTFKHAGMGVLRKMGAYNTGAYSFGSNWLYDVNRVNNPNDGHGVPFDDTSWVGAGSSYASVVRADYGGQVPRYHPIDYGSAGRGRGGWRAGQASELSTIQLPSLCAASEQTGRAPLLPLWVAVDRGSGLWSDVGYPPDMRFVRMDNLEPGQEYPLGTDTWLVFPVIRKNGAPGSPNSGVWGFAYRRAD